MALYLVFSFASLKCTEAEIIKPFSILKIVLTIPSLIKFLLRINYFQASVIKNINTVGQGLLSKKHLDGIRSKKIKNLIIASNNDGVGPDNTKKVVRMVLENSNIIPYIIDPVEYGNYKDPNEYF